MYLEWDGFMSLGLALRGDVVRLPWRGMATLESPPVARLRPKPSEDPDVCSLDNTTSGCAHTCLLT